MYGLRVTMSGSTTMVFHWPVIQIYLIDSEFC